MLDITTPILFTIWFLSIYIFAILVDFGSLPMSPSNIGDLIGITIIIGVTTFILMCVFAFLKKNKNIFSKDVYSKVSLLFGLLLIVIISPSYYFFRKWKIADCEKGKNTVYLQDVSDIQKSSPVIENIETPIHGYQQTPIIISEEQSYFISGNTKEELCNEVYEWQSNQNDEDTIANIGYSLIDNYYTVLTDSGWTIGNFTVTAKSLITVPQWESSGGASDNTKEAWRIFKNAVYSHEREHRDILIEYANRLVNEYNNLGYYSSDAAVRAALKSIYNSIYNQMNDAQNKFDDVHGKSDSFSELCY